MVLYQYNDSQWGDLLTNYNGRSFSYDAIGNLTNDGIWTYTWKHGRELATMSNGSTTWYYTYNADGLRIRRNNGSTTYTYVYNDGLLTQVTLDAGTYSVPMYITYDANGLPFTIDYNGVVYYYVLNAFGDVIGLANAAGNVVVEYTYDAWGNQVYCTGSFWNTLGKHNPLRYRSYIYDEETGLYYLQSRYYNPEIGRWISPDSVIANVGGSILGYNMFAYCFNNPVNMTDNTGSWPSWNDIKAGFAAAINWVDNNIIQPIKGFIEDVAEDFHNYDANNQSEQKVFESNYFSNYKGAFVLKTSFDTSFSFGIIGLCTQQQDSNTLKHEYGHTVQMQNLGVGRYITNVAIPSVIINLLDRQGKLPYDYYSYPWEAEANELGGATLSQKWMPPLPQGGDTSYWGLIRLFFE